MCYNRDIQTTRLCVVCQSKAWLRSASTDDASILVFRATARQPGGGRNPPDIHAGRPLAAVPYQQQPVILLRGNPHTHTDMYTHTRTRCSGLESKSKVYCAKSHSNMAAASPSEEQQRRGSISEERKTAESKPQKQDRSVSLSIRVFPTPPRVPIGAPHRQANSQRHTRSM